MMRPPPPLFLLVMLLAPLALLPSMAVCWSSALPPRHMSAMSLPASNALTTGGEQTSASAAASFGNEPTAASTAYVSVLSSRWSNVSPSFPNRARSVGGVEPSINCATILGLTS